MNAVHIRPWKLNDAQQLAAIANNKKIWNYLRDRFPSPYTVKDAIQWIQLCNTQQPIQNFAIEINQQIAGSVGVIPKEDVERLSLEVGYFIAEANWGKGIATQALAWLLEYIPQHYNVVRLFAHVFENNYASMKVLEKNGFTLESIRKKAIIKNNTIMNDYVYVKLLQ